MVEHRFGGSWTERKLEALGEYLVQYRLIFTRNLPASRLKTIYVDAFAGTGEREAGPPERSPGLFGYDDEVHGYQKGSAYRALSIEQPFHEYIFLEHNHKHAEALRQMLHAQFPKLENRCAVHEVDANQWLQDWCRKQDWRGQRAVTFLDPYGMSVEWATIESIAATKAIDLWVLFPFAIGAGRMMPRDSLPGSLWAKRLTRIFGTEEWQSRFYGASGGADLFGSEGSTLRVAGVDDILRYFIERLRAVFAGVVEHPMILENSKRSPMYALCFAAGNPKGAPTAVRIAGYLARN
jgi:three-Cys-motif partner protein